MLSAPRLILSAFVLTARRAFAMRPARVPMTGKGIRKSAALRKVFDFDASHFIERDSWRGLANTALAPTTAEYVRSTGSCIFATSADSLLRLRFRLFNSLMVGPFCRMNRYAPSR